MAGLNKVMLIGNVGKDPEVRHTAGGTTVCNFSLATTEKRKKGDKWEDATEWHRVTAFGKLATICGEYLSKGKQVYIDGRIQYGSYEKDGHTVYTTDIIVNQMVMLGGGSRQEQMAQQKDSAPQFDMEDDIPF